MNNAPAASKRPPNNQYAKNWIMISYDTTIPDVLAFLNANEFYVKHIEMRPYKQGLQLYQIYFRDWQKKSVLNTLMFVDQDIVEWYTNTAWNYYNPKDKFPIYRDVLARRIQLYGKGADEHYKELMTDSEKKAFDELYDQIYITDAEMNEAYDEYEENVLINELFDYYENEYMQKVKECKKIVDEYEMAKWKKDDKGYYVFDD